MKEVLEWGTKGSDPIEHLGGLLHMEVYSIFTGSFQAIREPCGVGVVHRGVAQGSCDLQLASVTSGVTA